MMASAEAEAEMETETEEKKIAAAEEMTVQFSSRALNLNRVLRNCLYEEGDLIINQISKLLSHLLLQLQILMTSFINELNQLLLYIS